MHGYGHKGRRNSSYSSDDSDSDSDAPNELTLSRFVGDVAELAVQPFEMATKMVLNPFGLFYSPPKPKGKKSRKGLHEGGYYEGFWKQPYNSEHGMEYQDKNKPPQAPPDHNNRIPASGRALVTAPSQYPQVTRLSCGNNKAGQGIRTL